MSERNESKQYGDTAAFCAWVELFGIVSGFAGIGILAWGLWRWLH